ncbi:MAG: helicase [Firmicutes bacterium]|nr:helicase [Bacillota bacterium]
MNITKLEKYISNKMYNRGYEYYEDNKIIGAYYDENKNRIVSSVIGTDIYDAIFNFDDYNELKSVSCTCPYFKKEKDVCKHLAALYFYLSNGNLKKIVKNSNKYENSKITSTFAKKNMESLFLNKYLTNNSPIFKTPLKTYYRIHYQPYSFYNFTQLSLKLGVDQLYVVNNLEDLLTSIESNTPLFFGKKFTFDPKIHKFSDEDRKIFDFIFDLYSTQKLISMGSHYSPDKIITNKGLSLDKKLFIRFLKLLGNSPFELKIEDTKISDVTTEFKSTPFNLALDSIKTRTVAKINSPKPYNILSNDDDIIVYSDKKLFVINDKSDIFPFIKFSLDNNSKQIFFSKENEEKIISFISTIKDKNNVYLSKEIKERFIHEELKTSLYIDKFKSGISVEIKFNYGDEYINPYSQEKLNPYVIRDYDGEEEIHNIFESSYFIVSNGKLYLSGTNKIFRFFKETLSDLRDLCDVYYTDAVKNYYTPRINSAKVTINSLLNGNLFDISIDMDDFDKDEIYEILQAIKEKKKFHKLKSDRLVNLEEDVPQEISSLLENIDTSEIKGNTISLDKYRIVNVFNNIDENISYDEIENSDYIFNIVDKIKNFNPKDIKIPNPFETILRDYQKIGYKWLSNLANVDFGGILADDMGLGKTIQAITFMYAIKNQGTSLVVAPSSLLYNWKEEIEKFAPELKTLVVAGPKSTREKAIAELSKYDVLITSYPLIRRDVELYGNFNFNCFILDEAQHIKNPDSLNAKSVKSIKSNYRFALTGTPIENSLTELWSIFDFILPGFLLSQGKFSNQFEKPIVKDKNRKSLDKLTNTISPFILRRKKADVLKELPEKIESKLLCDLTKKQRQLYDAYLFDMKVKIDQKITKDGFDKSRFEILSYITRLRQICCHPSVFMDNYEGKSGKIELLNELLEELIDSGHKILLFSQFTSLLSLIKSELDKRNISYSYLDGQTKVSERMNLVKDFNNSDKDVFLISLKAGGTGLNLTSADTVIHFDPWWNPAVEDQATDRAHRIGQLNSVNVYKLIAKDTIEEKIYQLQLKKKELIDSVIKKGESFVTALSEKEIRELFEI